MIHPFAHFSAAPVPGESLWERAALLEKPAADFAEFLRSTRTEGSSASGVDPAPQRSASGAAETRVGPGSPSRARETGEQAAVPPPTDTSAQGLPDETIPDTESDANPADSPRSGQPRFADVPDSAKYPAGPYHQAPPEHGGEWWLVSPFTGSEPWLNEEMASASALNPATRFAPQNLPQDFLQAFGEMPTHRRGENSAEFAGRVSRWKQDLEFFQRIGTPDGLDEAQIELASTTYEQWGMGQPVFYEGRYGWFARFPESAVPEFEMDAASAVSSPHLAIARFQVRLLRQGEDVALAHPFVPPHLLPENA